MDRGGAILGQTSLPVGGVSSNCVVAGHRTWNGAIQFKGLDLLQPNDMVYITNPWERLSYKVIETKIISPNDSDEVMIQEGRDLLTVFTCTYRLIAWIAKHCAWDNSPKARYRLLTFLREISVELRRE